MGLSGAIASLGGSPYTVTRRAAGTMPGGVFTAGATSSLTISALVYPVTGAELKRLSEGRTDVELRALVTTTAVLVPKDAAGGGAGGDLVSIDGASWEVETVEKWAHLGSTFYKAIVRRVV